jgi:hypothetical protein
LSFLGVGDLPHAIALVNQPLYAHECLTGEGAKRDVSGVVKSTTTTTESQGTIRLGTIDSNTSKEKASATIKEWKAVVGEPHGDTLL